MQRYFGLIENGKVALSKDDVFHFTRVMRAKVGDEIEVVYNNEVFLAKAISFTPLDFEIIKKLDENNELENEVILVASLIKGEKMDLVLQKATELGVNEIVLLQTERTIVKIRSNELDAKLERFRKITKEAAEQSKRSRIPTLKRLLDVNHLNEIDADIKLIAYEGLEGSSKSFASYVNSIKKNQKIAIVIGPEGGFSEQEVKKANEQGFVSVGLGKRILRAETACFYTLSVIANALEAK